MNMQQNLDFWENVSGPHEFDKLFIIPPLPEVTLKTPESLPAINTGE